MLVTDHFGGDVRGVGSGQLLHNYVVFKQIAEPLHNKESVVNCGRVSVAFELAVSLSRLAADIGLIVDTAGHEARHSQELELSFGHKLFDQFLFGNSQIEVELSVERTVFVVKFHDVIIGAVTFASARVDLAEAARTDRRTCGRKWSEMER